MQSGDLDAELVAVIAAAVAMVIKQPHRIAAISASHIAHPYLHAQAWAIEGRRHIHLTRRAR